MLDTVSGFKFARGLALCGSRTNVIAGDARAATRRPQAPTAGVDVLCSCGNGGRQSLAVPLPAHLQL